MKLLVVILNYRVTDLTIDCLRSLAGRADRMSGTKVAVLENGTGGDAFPRIRDAIASNGWGSWAELTETHPNRGFCGGNNLVIRAAFAGPDPPEYVLLPNCWWVPPRARKMGPPSIGQQGAAFVYTTLSPSVTGETFRATLSGSAVSVSRVPSAF